MRFSLLLSLILGACSPNSDAIGTQQQYRGLVDVGPHGPVYTPSEVLKSAAVEFVPWRMSGKELDPQEVEQALSGNPLKVEFRGREVPVTPNGDGFDREVLVTEWVHVQPCKQSALRLRECLDE